jgi:ATP-dependent RNA helicase DDX55/SPB4
VVKLGGEANDGRHPLANVLPRMQMDTFAYADKAREKQRLEALETRKAEVKSSAMNPTSKKKKMRGTVASESAWSQQKAKRERKEERREKKVRKREFEKKQQKQEQGEEQAHLQQQLPSSKEDAEDIDDDWAQDEREAKKAKKGRAGQETFTNSQFEDL